jgi:hypothetical protein
MQPVDTTHGGNDPSAGMGARKSQYPHHEPVKMTLLYTDETSMALTYYGMKFCFCVDAACDGSAVVEIFTRSPAACTGGSAEAL